MSYEQDLQAYITAITAKPVYPFKAGDKITCTWITYGEAIYDRKGQMIHRPPLVEKQTGVVYFVGKVYPVDAVRVRCHSIKKNESDFDFYLQDIKENKFTVTLESQK